MIITVLIIPLSLPAIFLTLLYLATHNTWFMTLSHLSRIEHWHGITGYLCVILIMTIAAITLVAVLLTALLTALLNHRLPQHQRPPFKSW